MSNPRTFLLFILTNLLMPPLPRVIADHDLGLLRLIAELWGLELSAGSQREAAAELAARMLEPELAAEVISALPPEPRAAFEQLAREGRQLLASFTRRYGELRGMGPARRDRERPWANAPSASEVLWYRGLIGRAFFDAGRGPEEFVFIPDDLRSLAYVAPAGQAAPPPAPPGWPVNAPEPAATNPGALSAGGDDAVTVLAYLQVVPARLEAAGPLPVAHQAALARYLRQPPALEFTLRLLRQLGLVAEPAPPEPLHLHPEQVQPFLQAGSPERARRLAEAWRDTRDWNDLLAVPGLVFEGHGWHNDPTIARQAILKLLAQVPADTWWSLDGFVAAIKDRQPDFQRPAGDYDSWYIRDTASGAYLRGFENWDRVDGALVRWVIEQPLAWLGAVETTVVETEAPKTTAEKIGAETAGVAPGGGPVAFRLTAYGAALVGLAGWPEAPDTAPLEVDAGGRVRAVAGASGYDRFQLARISDWLPPEISAYPYRLSPASLARAASKGISPGRIVTFLERAAAGQPALPALAAALARWQTNGAEAAVHETVVLRLAGAELLETLRATPGLRGLLGESLGPAAVEVRRADLERLRQALAEMGILLDGSS